MRDKSDNHLHLFSAEYAEWTPRWTLIRMCESETTAIEAVIANEAKNDGADAGEHEYYLLNKETAELYRFRSQPKPAWRLIG